MKENDQWQADPTRDILYVAHCVGVCMWGGGFGMLRPLKEQMECQVV